MYQHEDDGTKTSPGRHVAASKQAQVGTCCVLMIHCTPLGLVLLCFLFRGMSINEREEFQSRLCCYEVSRVASVNVIGSTSPNPSPEGWMPCLNRLYGLRDVREPAGFVLPAARRSSKRNTKRKSGDR
jgi:hypothetical protein